MFFFFTQRFQKSIRPLNTWRSNNTNTTRLEVESMEPERVEGPFTVTLTDMDFTAMTWESGSQAWPYEKTRFFVSCDFFFFINYHDAKGPGWALVDVSKDCVLQDSVDELLFIIYTKAYYYTVFLLLFFFVCVF